MNATEREIDVFRFKVILQLHISELFLKLPAIFYKIYHWVTSSACFGHMSLSLLKFII